MSMGSSILFFKDMATIVKKEIEFEFWRDRNKNVNVVKTKEC